MNACRLMVLCAVLTFQQSAMSAQPDLPPAAMEILKQFDKENAEVDRKIDAAIKERVEKTAGELKKLQDILCKEAKLDEAVAVRDLIRALKSGKVQPATDDLPAAAKEIYKEHESAVADIHKKGADEPKKRWEKILVELKKLQDQFCKDAKLDEAVAVRDLLRSLKEGGSDTLPDPGYINNPATDIGKTFYYTVVGVSANQSIYGTDVYTTGSHLGLAAVHSGVLKDGQKGLVKVTILPGQDTYPSTTRNGITSTGYGAYTVSFKVERAYVFRPERR